MSSPFWVIARKEFVENVLSLRYQVSSILCLLLVAGSALLSVAGLEQELKTSARTDAERQARLGEGILIADFFWRPLPYQKKPSPVAVFASGLESTMTRPIHLQRKWWKAGTLSAGASPVEAPVFRLFTRPDLVYIVAVVLSLLAMITGHDAITREREVGTLKLLLSCSVPRDAVILGKGIGGFLAVILPLVTALLAAAFIHVVLSPLPLTGEGWVRLGWIGLVSAGYVAAFLFMGIFISALVERSATSLIAGLFAWILLALLLPHAGPILASKLEPVETMSEVAARKKALEGALRPRLEEKYRDVRRGWQRRILIRDELARETASLDQERRRAMIRQLRLGRFVSRISPAGAFIFGTTEVSGTGVWSYLRFLEEAERLNRDFNSNIESVFNKAFTRRGGKRHRVWETTLGADDMPVFNPTVLSSREGIARGVWEVFGLACYTVFFFFAGFLAFLRADVA